MANNYVYPKFTRSLLLPKYWLTWFGIGVLYLLVQLPYPLICRFGRWLGRKSMRFLKRRVGISQRNLELCFPTMSQSERQQLLIKNFESTGLALFETGMAWFWSDRRIKKHSRLIGVEHMEQAKKNNRGMIVIGVHFLTLELGGRILGQQYPGIGVYRPNDNPVLDYVQLKGRLRSNKYMLDRKNVKGMIRALEEGEILWYAPDHDYGARNSVFAPFFAVEKAATTIGTSILVRFANPALIPFTPKREANNKGYSLIIAPELKNYPLDDQVAAATFMNRAIEKEILLAPEQYMWLHRRFKTRPPGEPSLY